MTVKIRLSFSSFKLSSKQKICITHTILAYGMGLFGAALVSTTIWHRPFGAESFWRLRLSAWLLLRTHRRLWTVCFRYCSAVFQEDNYLVRLRNKPRIHLKSGNRDHKPFANPTRHLRTTGKNAFSKTQKNHDFSWQ